MANVLIEERTMSAIGDAIRGKTGKEDLIFPADMAGEIEGIEAGGSGDLDALIEGTLTEIESNVETIPYYKFYNNSALEHVNFPEVMTAHTLVDESFWDTSYDDETGEESEVWVEMFVNYSYVFCDCKNLVSALLPKLESIEQYMFNGCCKLEQVDVSAAKYIGVNGFGYCENLKSIVFPSVETVHYAAFYRCNNLEVIDFHAATKIDYNSFYGCNSLKALVLRNESSVCGITDIEVWEEFSCEAIRDGNCYFYVPSALIDQYKIAGGLENYASQFRVLEDYTVDGTVTGELDETKI